MKRKAVIAFAMLSTLLTGCSTIDWVGTGEAWRESLCREEYRTPCPDEDHLERSDLR